MKLKYVIDIIRELPYLQSLSVETVDFDGTDLTSVVRTLVNSCPTLKQIALSNAPDPNVRISEVSLISTSC
jgi:hypothetical protein